MDILPYLSPKSNLLLCSHSLYSLILVSNNITFITIRIIGSETFYQNFRQTILKLMNRSAQFAISFNRQPPPPPEMLMTYE